MLFTKNQNLSDGDDSLLKIKISRFSSSLKPIPTVAGRCEANETTAAFNSDAALSETKNTSRIL